jgi:hypothetical protein
LREYALAHEKAETEKESSFRQGNRRLLAVDLELQAL